MTIEEVRYKRTEIKATEASKLELYIKKKHKSDSIIYWWKQYILLADLLSEHSKFIDSLLNRIKDKPLLSF